MRPRLARCTAGIVGARRRPLARSSAAGSSTTTRSTRSSGAAARAGAGAGRRRRARPHPAPARDAGGRPRLAAEPRERRRRPRRAGADRDARPRVPRARPARLGRLRARARAWFDPWVGVLAAADHAHAPAVLDFGARAYVDIPYLVLVLGALLVETRRPRAGLPVLALLAVAGLIRPEAWLFSARLPRLPRLARRAGRPPAARARRGRRERPAPLGARPTGRSPARRCTRSRARATRRRRSAA